MDWVDRLKQAVDARGKQSAVAAAAGVDASALSDILRRQTSDPKVQTLLKLCRECGITLGWLFGELGFELGEADFRFLGDVESWAREKRELRRSRDADSRPRMAPPLPAVATPRGETWDADELRDRAIPPEYQTVGANAVFVTRGDSMVDAGIFDGDYLFVRKSKNWRVANRQIVVCRLDGTFTVKRLHIEAATITLRSENGKTRPTVIDEDQDRFEMIGVVLGIARDLFRR